MKKLISVIFALALILTAAAGAEGNSHLEEIKSRGTLIVGTEGTWSPYTYHDEEEKLVGFDVEVARLIADYIGVDVQYSETVWSSIFGSLDAGQIDLVVNEVSYTEERAAKLQELKAGKDYQVGKWRCTRCGDTGFFRSGNAAGSKIIPISEQEYRTYLNEYKAFVRGE